MEKQLEKSFLLGNDAIARAAIAADVRVVTTYPGRRRAR